MSERTFGHGGAVGYGLAAAMAFALFDHFGQDWLAAVFWLLALMAAYHVIGWFVETSQELWTGLRANNAAAARAELVAHDRTLILAESIATMDAERVQVFGQVAGAQYDPYDPQSVIMPGFALLTRSFAVMWFAGSLERPMPLRAFAEGRRDRQREQASELLDWLVTEGFVQRAGAYGVPHWAEHGSVEAAMERLGL